MNVFTVTLIAIAAMLGVLAFVAPTIVAMLAHTERRNIPADVFAARGPRVFGFKPKIFWSLAGIAVYGAQICRSYHWQKMDRLVSASILLLIAVLLISYFLWSFRFLKSRAESENHLRRYAKYVFCLSSLGIVLGVVFCVFILSHPRA
jgi:uncharacterized membrane protein